MGAGAGQDVLFLKDPSSYVLYCCVNTKCGAFPFSDRHWLGADDDGQPGGDYLVCVYVGEQRSQREGKHCNEDNIFAVIPIPTWTGE